MHYEQNRFRCRKGLSLNAPVCVKAKLNRLPALQWKRLLHLNRKMTR